MGSLLKSIRLHFNFGLPRMLQFVWSLTGPHFLLIVFKMGNYHDYVCQKLGVWGLVPICIYILYIYEKYLL